METGKMPVLRFMGRVNLCHGSDSAQALSIYSAFEFF